MSENSLVLTDERLENLKRRISSLGKGDCDNSVLRAAQKIGDPEFGGTAHNIYAVLPQLAQEVLKGADPETKIHRSPLNIDNNATIDRPELLAAMVAAAQIAHKQHIELKDVPVDEIAKLSPEICKKLQGEMDLSCKAPRR